MFEVGDQEGTSLLRFARSSRFLTEDGDHFPLPRGVRSCRRSSWTAMSRRECAGFEAAMPATNVISRSSGRRGGNVLSKFAFARCSLTSHLTARRNRSGGEEMADRTGETIQPNTTSTSPDGILLTSRASSGRALDAPDPCSTTIVRSRRRATRFPALRWTVRRWGRAHSQ